MFQQNVFIHKEILKATSKSRSRKHTQQVVLKFYTEDIIFLINSLDMIWNFAIFEVRI